MRHAGGSYATPTAWSTAAAGPPIAIPGLDANSKAGDGYVSADGAPTAALDHDQAVALPVDAELNAYLPAGTRRFGCAPLGGGAAGAATRRAAGSARRRCGPTSGSSAGRCPGAYPPPTAYVTMNPGLVPTNPFQIVSKGS